jgi:hypothetical protein
MENSQDFIASWDRYLTIGAFVFAGFAGLILLYHEFRLFLIKDYKEKYDYVNLHEIRYFWYAVIALIGAAALWTNALASKLVVFASALTWFYVRVFMTAGFAVIAYVLFYSLVRIYYPRYVEKRLNKLRNKPRISPAGNVMRKLREAEEEAHLEATQWSEQKEIHSIDYDVWLDEKTGYKKVEKYISYQHAVECPECGYVTMRITKEELADAPTDESPGILIKHFKCTYCGHREAKEVVISPLSTNSVDLQPTV